MKVHVCIPGVVSALLGWWGVSLYDSANVSPFARTVSRSLPGPAPELNALRNSAAGSKDFSRLAGLMDELPAGSLTDKQRAIILAWPPSSKRAFALALFDLRRSPVEPPDTKETSSGERPSNPTRDLAESIGNGKALQTGFSSFRESYGDHTLRGWADKDPAAAIAAILKLPPGTARRDGVDVIAESMGHFDPAGAMEFIIKSGEERLSTGAAGVLGYAMIKNPSLPVIRQYFERMTPAQQNSLLEGLALIVPDYQYNPEYSGFDDSNRNPSDPQHRSDLGLVACAALQTTHPGPGLESFARNLLNFPLAVEEVRAWLATRNSLTPAQLTALSIFDAEEARKAAATGSLEPLMQSIPSTFDRAAPSVIEDLASSRRLPEALPLLNRIQDESVRVSTLQTILPAWMGADPAAARAAFDAAPLTALERERWERHPAFRPPSDQ